MYLWVLHVQSEGLWELTYPLHADSSEANLNGREGFELIIFGSSNVGKVRKDNQDSYTFDIIDDNLGFAVVCDGMGGPGGGKIASATAVKSLAKHLASVTCDFDEIKIKETFNNAVASANSEIYSKALNDQSLTGMGTTLVSAVVINDTGYFINVGDSRAYLIRDDSIKRISHDHSAVQQLVDNGMLTESQARNHPNKNIITRALGVEQNVSFDFFKEKILPGDIILLCSDGITNYIDDLEIPFEAVKRKDNIETIPQKLIELANSRGGADNSTVVIMKA